MGERVWREGFGKFDGDKEREMCHFCQFLDFCDGCTLHLLPVAHIYSNPFQIDVRTGDVCTSTTNKYPRKPATYRFCPKPRTDGIGGKGRRKTSIAISAKCKPKPLLSLTCSTSWRSNYYFLSTWQGFHVRCSCEVNSRAINV